MRTAVVIRPEHPGDHEVLGEVISAAFAGRPYADGDEADLLVALRRRGALALSLVAERDGEVVGQAAFSPARAANLRDWYALGPVAVLPAHQRQGIGSRLIRSGIEHLVAGGAGGCIVYGDPEYYRRFDFRVCPANTPPGLSPEHFMVRLFAGAAPEGPVAFDEAFATSR